MILSEKYSLLLSFLVRALNKKKTFDSNLVSPIWKIGKRQHSIAQCVIGLNDKTFNLYKLTKLRNEHKVVYKYY